MQLGTVVDAYARDGIYNELLELHLTLESEHFLEEEESSKLHRVLVLRDKETQVESVAVDEFPEMLPDSLASFQQRKRQHTRERRGRLLKELVESDEKALQALEELFPSKT